MDFVRELGPVLDELGIKIVDQDKIYEGIMKGDIHDSRQGANILFDGDINTFNNRIRKINKDVFKSIWDNEKYHNDMQKSLGDLKIKEYVVYRVRAMGYSSQSTYLAKFVYRAAYKLHEYSMAADLAFSIADYNTINGNSDQAKKWCTKWEIATHEDSTAKIASIHASEVIDKMNRDRSSLKCVDLIRTTVAKLSKYIATAEGYKFWYRYNWLEVFLFECLGQYDNMLEKAESSYEYFANLHFNHRAAKLTFLSSIIHSLNIVGRYKEALSYLDLVEENKDAGANYDMAMIRIARSLISLGENDKALKILKVSTPKNKNHIPRLNRCIGYATGKPYKASSKNATSPFDRLDKMWFALINDKELTETDTIRHYFDRNKEIKETKEYYMINILDNARHKGFSKKRFNKLQIMNWVDQMNESHYYDTESEILDFNKMCEYVLS